MSDKEDKESNIIKLFDEAMPQGGITAGRDVNVHINNSTTYINQNPARNRAPVESQNGDITPAHKQRIKELVEAIVKNTGESYPAVWSKLHRKFKVNEYHALSEKQYTKVLRWLKQWYASSKP